jgi:hypothetical protein
MHLYKNTSIKTEFKLIPKHAWYVLIVFFTSISLLFVDKLIGTVFACLWFLVTLYLTYQKKKKISETFLWKKVKAKVLKKKIIKYICILRPKLYPYRLDIKYIYTINGEEYISSQYAMGNYGDTRCNYFYELSQAQEMMRSLIKNKETDILVNPLNPEESIIVAGVDSAFSPSYIFVFMEFLIVFLFVYMSWMN